MSSYKNGQKIYNYVILLWLIQISALHWGNNYVKTFYSYCRKYFLHIDENFQDIYLTSDLFTYY